MYKDKHNDYVILFDVELADMLYVDPVSDDMTDFPSPEELKYKIIIKAKKAGSERNRSSSRHIKLSLASPSDIDSLTEEANLQETDQSSLVDYCKSLNDSSITVPTKIESSNDQSAPEKGWYYCSLLRSAVGRGWTIHSQMENIL